MLLVVRVKTKEHVLKTVMLGLEITHGKGDSFVGEVDGGRD